MQITLFEKNECRWFVFLLFFSLLTHAYSIAVLGAKYWIDSIAYFQLAAVLFDAEQLAQLYNGPFGFFYQHVGAGLPLLIRAADFVLHERMWIALSVFQGLLSALAVTYFVLSFREKLGRVGQLIAVVLCGLHPYFVAFHAAALTESVSASILLFSLGIAIRVLDGRLPLYPPLCLLLLLSIVAAQFRPYLGLVGILVGSVIVFQRGGRWRIPLYLITVLALVVGALAFPVYRAALGTGFFLPNVGTLILTHVAHVSWDLDDDAARALTSVVLNDEIRARLIGKDPVSYDDAKHILNDLVSSGLSPAEAKQKIAAAAWRVRVSSFPIIERQLQLPLASIGFQYAAVCCQPSRLLTRDMTSSRMFSHIRQYFRWNSGVDKASYLKTFDTFSETVRSSNIFAESIENAYISSVRPYVTDRLKSFRDPLFLSLLISDPLILAGWFGLLLCFWPGQRAALLVVAIPFAVIYAASVYAHVTGDNRHAHPLIPILIVGVVKAAQEFIARGYWLKLRRLFSRASSVS